MNLIKKSEEKILLKAQKEKAEQDKIIAEIEQRRLERQAVVDAVERDFKTELNYYKNRCDINLGHMDCFTRLCYFLSTSGANRKAFQNNEWNAAIERAGLTEIVELINKTGSPPLKAPVRKQVDPLEDD